MKDLPDLKHPLPLPIRPTCNSHPILGTPQKALCGGIPCSFLEPFARSWSHFVGIYRQKIDKVSEELTLRYPHEEPWVEKTFRATDYMSIHFFQFFQKRESGEA